MLSLSWLRYYYPGLLKETGYNWPGWPTVSAMITALYQLSYNCPGLMYQLRYNFMAYSISYATTVMVYYIIGPASAVLASCINYARTAMA